MNKQEIFEQAKEQMIHHVQNELVFDTETIHSVFSGLHQYETFLKALCEIPIDENIKTSGTKTNVELLVAPAPSKQTSQHQVSDVESTQVENNSEPAYTFIRNLKGGHITIGGQNLYVPETIIRVLDINHGDKLRATSKGADKYYYEIAEKTNDPTNPERETIDYALVEKQDGMLIASRSMAKGGENIKINNYLHTFRIPNEDCLKFALKEGDLIDIAFNPNDPSYYRVIWKYEIEDMEQAERPKKAGEYKDKTKKTDSENKEQELEGKSVLVIGLEPRKSIFRQVIEDRGGNFLFLKGTEQENRFTSAIRKADVVVILTEFIRHRASLLAVKVCKEVGTSFSIVDTLGIPRILDGAINPSVECV